jgi:hypothetical protein
LYVFSTSTEFEPERPYTKFGAYARLEHHDDVKAAVRAVYEAGYGTRRAGPGGYRYDGGNGHQGAGETNGKATEAPPFDLGLIGSEVKVSSGRSISQPS